MNWNKLIRNLILGAVCFAFGYLVTDPAIFESTIATILIPIAMIGVGVLISYVSRKK